MTINPASKAVVAAVAALNEDQLSILSDEADSSCTNGYDSDGSTGYEIFENGFELAVKAAGRDVIAVDDPNDNVTYFLIGSEEEVLERIARLVEENPSEPAEVAS